MEPEGSLPCLQEPSSCPYSEADTTTTTTTTNNNNNIYLLQLGCHPVAVVISHVYKIWNWLLLDLSREG